MDSNIINMLDACIEAIIKRDIDALINCAKYLGLNSNCSSPLLDFTKNLIIENIKEFMTQNKKDSIRVSRNGAYNEETFDWYSLSDGELFRNGTKATFTSVGRLYVAYKKINIS